MLSERMIERLNQQINLEYFSANLYLQMSAWCDFRGYAGCAAFLRAHSAEELQHMHRLFTYVTETGGLPLVGAIARPDAEYRDLADVFKRTYEHEVAITRDINDLVKYALSEPDFSTFNFLQWYVSEQHEEEALFKSILDKIEMIGLDGKGVYFLDKEIAKLVVGPGARQGAAAATGDGSG